MACIDPIVSSCLPNCSLSFWISRSFLKTENEDKPGLLSASCQHFINAKINTRFRLMYTPSSKILSFSRT